MLPELAKAGLTAVQLSLQGADAASADAIADTRAHDEKLAFAAAVRALDLPLTVNVVLHAENIGTVPELVRLARDLGASRLELASAQYLGFALENRARLLPTRERIDEARAHAMAAKKAHHGTMEVLYVLPDYVRGKPRACMDGWARRFVHIAPDGTVLPCHAASTLPGMGFESIAGARLRDLWETNPGLLRFRGTEWMKEPCRSCDERERDFGGCRCQAFALTGDASATDPACALSPDHELVRGAAREPSRRYLFRGRKAAP
jgi:pyrroloquinoline quinone biosynthesis protein E